MAWTARRHEVGLHTTARYYYYPGWHEPGTTLEFGFNKKAYEALPVDLRRILDHAAGATQSTGARTTRRRTPPRLEKLKTEFKDKVEILQLPAPVLRDLKKLAAEVVKAESEKSPMAKKSVCLLHEVPGAAHRLVPCLRRRLPAVRGAVTLPGVRRYAFGLIVALVLVGPLAAEAQQARRAVPRRDRQRGVCRHPSHRRGPQGRAPRCRAGRGAGCRLRHPVHGGGRPGAPGPRSRRS